MIGIYYHAEETEPEGPSSELKYPSLPLQSSCLGKHGELRAMGNLGIWGLTGKAFVQARQAICLGSTLSFWACHANHCLYRPLMTSAWQYVQLQCSYHLTPLILLLTHSSPRCLLRPCRSKDSLVERRSRANRQMQRVDMSATTGDSAATETRAVPLSELRELVYDSLLGLSYSKREAEIIGDVSLAFTVA